MDEISALAELTERLRRAVVTAPAGVLPFEEFMRRALYEPDLGYYERTTGQIGREGDFYTSVTTGPLFGEMLAFQFSEWLSALDSPPGIVEIGAHDGRLAHDILRWFQKWRPAQFESLSYTLVEASPFRQSLQQERLASMGSVARWVGDVPLTRGIVFSNELLDAFPVRAIRWDARRRVWQELGVAWDSGRFVEVAFPRRADTPVPELPVELQSVLPDGFLTEFSPAAEAWWSSTAQELQQGYLMAIDYGLTAEEFIVPQRRDGTRRGYRKHHPVTDLVAEPGACDLTAHVNFTRIQLAGEAAGLKTVRYCEQRVGLTDILRDILRAPNRFAAWSPALNRQFQTLTHPEHLGRSFRWLIQTRQEIP